MQERAIIHYRRAELHDENTLVGMQHDGCGPSNWLSLGASEAEESCPDGMMIGCMDPLKKSSPGLASR